MTGMSSLALTAVSRNPLVGPTIPDGPAPPTVKARMCNRFNTAEGCKFGDKCHIAHRKRELGKPIISSCDDRSMQGFQFQWCPFREGCHFLHYTPGGISAMAQMTGMSNLALTAVSRNPLGGPTIPDGPAPPPVKTRRCNKFNTAEGCKFGDKCHIAHGKRELGKPIIL